MSFLAPFFLFGLGALLVPIIIHMWSKDARQTVAFGSLRFLKETETRTTRSIMPSQWLLLLVRLLLLTLLVFLLAEMLLSATIEKSPRMYLVDQVYQDSELVSNLMDTVAEGVEVRWLAEGFPSIDQPITSSGLNYWKLLSRVPGSSECVVVISPLHQIHFTGKRKPISPICQWIKPPIEPDQKELARIEKDGNTYLLTANYDEWATSMEYTEGENGNPIEVSYHLKVDEAYKNLETIFDAAIASIQSVSKITLKKKEELSQAEWVIWLSDAPTPKGVSLISIDEVLNWTSAGNNTHLIPKDLTMEEAIQMELPRKMLEAFMDNFFEVRSNDLLSIDTRFFEYNDGLIGQDDSENASSYLWVGLLGLFLIERWLSYKSSMVTI